MGERRSNSCREATEPTAASTRKIFREMIKAEIEAKPLTWRQRGKLVAFAEHLDIENKEATLLLRAVEFECDDQSTTTAISTANAVPGANAVPAPNADVEHGFVTTSVEHPISLVCATLLLATLLCVFIIVQLIA